MKTFRPLVQISFWIPALFLMVGCDSSSTQHVQEAIPAFPKSFLHLEKLVKPEALLTLEDPTGKDDITELHQIEIHAETGDLFVLPTHSSNGVIRYSNKGKFLKQYGTQGPDDDQYLASKQIIIDQENNRLLFLAAFKILVFDLDHDQQTTIQLNDVFDDYQDLATFENFGPFDQGICILVKVSRAGQTLYDLWQVPNSLAFEQARLLTTIESKTNTDPSRGAHFSSCDSQIFFSIPPNYDIQMISANGQKKVIPYPGKIAAGKIPGWGDVIEFKHFDCKDNRLWMTFEEIFYLREKRAYFANAFYKVDEGRMYLVDYTNLAKATEQEKSLYLAMSRGVLIDDNLSYGFITLGMDIEHIESYMNTLPKFGPQDQNFDLILFSLNQDYLVQTH